MLFYVDSCLFTISPLQGSIELLNNHRFSPQKHDSSHFICYAKAIGLITLRFFLCVAVLLELFMLILTIVFIHNFPGETFFITNEKLQREKAMKIWAGEKAREPN